MTEFHFLPMEPGVISAEVEEGSERTAHRVVVPDDFLDQLGLPEADPVDVIRETMGFLLDRQPITAVPDEFSLYDISQQYDDFTSELIARLAA